jgi:2-polyprenyl-3-methyl-5-hydroxy-6-metoxy-1,4-benzoquinol methylase
MANVYYKKIDNNTSVEEIKKITKDYDEFANSIIIYNELKKAHLDILLKLSKNKSILDFGAGTGNISSELLKKNYKVTSVDISEDSLKILKEKCKLNKDNLKVYTELSEINSKFEAINMMNVLYHIKKPKETVGKLSSLICKDGIIIVSGPIKHIDIDIMFSKIKKDLINSNRYDEKQFQRILSINKNIVSDGICYDKKSIKGFI